MLFSVAVLAAACAPSSELADTGGRPVGETAGDAPADTAETAAGQAVDRGTPVGVADGGVRLGSGRAVMAATGGQTTLILTTIGVHALVDEQLIGLDLGPGIGPPTGVHIADDGSVGALRWPDRVQLWGLGPEVRLIGQVDTVEPEVAFVGDQLFIVTDRELRIVATADGGELARHQAPDGRTFGPLVADPAAAWWAVAMVDPAGPLQLLVAAPDGGEPSTQTVADSDQSGVYQLDADPTRPRVLIGTSADGGRFSGGEVIVWDLQAATASSVHPVEPAELWAGSADGGLVIIDRDLVTGVGPDGAERWSQPMPEGYPPFAIHGLPTGGFAVILQDTSRLLIDVDAGDEAGVDRDVVELIGEPAPPDRFALTSQVAGSPPTISVVDHTGAVTVLGPDGAVQRDIEALVAGTINDIAVSVTGDLAVATSTGSINLRARDATGGSWTSELVNAEGNVDTVVFSPDGTQLVGGVAERRSEIIFDDTVAVWDLDDERRIVEIGGEREEVQDCSSFANVVRLAADGSFLVGLSHDFTVFVLDGETYERRHTMAPHAAPILDMALSPDDRWLVTSSEDATIRIWDTDSGELVADYPTVVGGYRSIDVLADGNRLLAVDRLGAMSVLDPLTGEVESTFESVVSGASDVEISPDGRFVAAGDGPVLRVWAADSGQVIGEFGGHYGSVTTAAFADGGSTVISGSADGTAVVWDLEA